jgi:hypothetical protein
MIAASAANSTVTAEITTQQLPSPDLAIVATTTLPSNPCGQSTNTYRRGAATIRSKRAAIRNDDDDAGSPVSSYGTRPRVAGHASMAHADMIASSRRVTPLAAQGGHRTDLAKPRSHGRTHISTAHRTLSSAPQWGSSSTRYGPLACTGTWANASASIACQTRISLTSTPGSTAGNQRTKRTSSMIAVHAGLHHASSAASSTCGGGLQWRTVWRQHSPSTGSIFSRVRV